MKNFYSIFITLILAGTLFSQNSSLYLPLDIQRAYQNETRSYDGSPGHNYWLNHTDYKIHVRFNPQSGQLNGKAEMLYFNNSPDTLRKLVLRLYPDLFKKGTMRDWPVNPTDLHDGVDIQSISVNSSAIPLQPDSGRVQRVGTNMTLTLKQALLPRSKTSLKIEWQFSVAQKTPIRTGKYDSTSYFIAYWYPQIAVYDDINGWDRYNYGGLQEFYNDPSNYDVTVSVPSGFTVWATGVLQNPKALLPKNVFKRYKKARTSDRVVHLIDSTEIGKETFIINPDSLSWHFTAAGVPDFAFALSDHYLWDMTSLVVDKKSGRRTVVQAAYKKGSKDFYKVAELARSSLDFFSQRMPAVPFPYPELTVFNGRGGMEFPMMVNDGSQKKLPGTVHVTSHEIAHSYFPFFMGTNERKYAWMDEGWATMLPFIIQNELAPEYDPIVRAVKRYEEVAGQEFDLPMSVPSIVYNANAYRPSYRNASYDRPGLAYYFLQNALGDELFLKALHAYMEEWNHKHPQPFDFFFTFDRVAGEDLSWFWKPWFFEMAYPDLDVVGVKKNENGATFLVENKGGLPIPVYLEVELEDGQKVVTEKSVAIWKSGKKQVTIPVEFSGEIKNISLDSPHIPDVFPEISFKIPRH